MNYIQKAKNILSEKIKVEEDLLDLYTLIVLTKGIDATLGDIHEAWAVWRNKTNPDHKSLVPFYELTETIQELDREYTEAVQETARELLAEPNTTA